MRILRWLQTAGIVVLVAVLVVVSMLFGLLSEPVRRTRVEDSEG